MQLVDVTHHDDHTVEFTISIDSNELNTELQKTAKTAAKKFPIPGFRPGKAPYNVVEKTLGREYLVAETIDRMGDEWYRTALEEAKIDPYDIGEISDFNVDEAGLKIAFRVPKTPQVELGDYRNIRKDYQVPVVTDEQVERTFELLYHDLALTEVVDRPSAFGDAVTITLHSHFVEADEAENEKHEEHEDPQDHDPHNQPNRETYMHEHNFLVHLTENPGLDRVMPGFGAQLVGVQAGDKRSFSLSFGHDEEIAESLRGRTVHFDIEVESVLARIEPPKDDFLAVLATDGKYDTLSTLKVEIRKDLEGNLQKSSEEIFADAVLNEVIQISHIKYPAAFLENYLDMIMEDFDDNLRRQYGIDLDTYCSITGQTKETLREKRRTQTEHDVRLILVIDKLAQVEELEVDVEQMNAVIAKEINNFEASLANLLEQVYSNPDTRQRVARQIVTDRVKQRLIDIAKGIEVPIGLDEKMLVEINMNTTSAGAENESTEGETAPASSETPDASAEAGVETEQN